MRATDETRTRDLHLGKVAYYQLYYYRTYLSGTNCSLLLCIPDVKASG